MQIVYPLIYVQRLNDGLAYADGYLNILLQLLVFIILHGSLCREIAEIQQGISLIQSKISITICTSN